jgi:hypothetical protein
MRHFRMYRPSNNPWITHLISFTKEHKNKTSVTPYSFIYQRGESVFLALFSKHDEGNEER